MIKDANLMFADDTKPDVDAAIITICAANDGALGGLKVFIPFGNFSTFGGSPVVVDLAAATDFGQGRYVTARFDITTTFAGAVANNVLFAVAVSSVPTFLSDATVIARGTEWATASLLAGEYDEIVLPRLASLLTATGPGKRYLTLGMEVYVPVTDWTAGGVTAHLTLDTAGDKPARTSGFAVL